MAHDPQKTYLGDGLYAELDPGRMIVLRTQRSQRSPRGEEHWVRLEPEVFCALIEFAHKIGWGDVIKAGAPKADVLSDKEYAELQERDERIRNQREYEGD
jgi:hypothetical protein